MATKVEEKLTPVFFSLETTGLDVYDQVIHIQILSKKFGTQQIYTIPDVSINPIASHYNKFQVYEGRLFRNQKLIPDTLDRMQAWTKFAEFVLSHENPVLICQNLNFQGRFIRQEITETTVAEMLAETPIVDSLYIWRRKLPDLKKYTLENLALHVKNIDYDSTNTEMKVFVLKSLFKRLEVRQDELHFYKHIMKEYLQGKPRKKRKSPYPVVPKKSKKMKMSLLECEEQSVEQMCSNQENCYEIIDLDLE